MKKKPVSKKQEENQVLAEYLQQRDNAQKAILQTLDSKHARDVEWLWKRLQKNPNWSGSALSAAVWILMKENQVIVTHDNFIKLNLNSA